MICSEFTDKVTLLTSFLKTNNSWYMVGCGYHGNRGKKKNRQRRGNLSRTHLRSTKPDRRAAGGQRVCRDTPDVCQPTGWLHAQVDSALDSEGRGADDLLICLEEGSTVQGCRESLLSLMKGQKSETQSPQIDQV